MSKDLTEKQARFVAAYCSGKSATQAAIDAGFAPKNARTRGYDLLTQNPRVKAAVEAHREKLRLATGITSETAMAKFQAAYDLAVGQKNMTAAVRALELQAKLAGLLDNKDKGAAGVNWSLNIYGLSDKPQQEARDVTPPLPTITVGTPAAWTGPQPPEQKPEPRTKMPPDIFG
jgi:hypothetical protein